MENQKQDPSYREIKEKARLFYKSIGSVWCPALDDEVFFDESGFRHLVQKGRRFRMKSEQKRRFALLKYAREVLESSSKCSENVRGVENSRAHYWKFKKDLDGIAITVVVRQMEGDDKRFLSIYGKKQKSAPESADS
jgi:hypothetical protein